MQGATVSHEDQESFLGLEKVRISNCKPLTPEEDKEFKDLMTTVSSLNRKLYLLPYPLKFVELVLAIEGSSISSN